MRARNCWLAAVAVLMLAPAAGAKDAYYRVPVVNLKLTEGELPKPEEQAHWRRWRAGQAMQPRVLLDGQGEAFVGPRFASSWQWERTVRGEAAVHVAAPEGQKVTGRLFVPNAEWTGMVALRFEIAPEAATVEARRLYFEAKRDYYADLLRQGLPGGAWFRHEMRLAERELGQRTEGTVPEAPGGQADWQGQTEVERTYALFTGGRAVSENLQLDRLLPAPRPGQPKDEMVRLDSIQGITVPDMDWKKLTEGMTPKLDPLASMIPADQHVVFFPSFAAAVALADEADRQGTPVLRLAEPRSESARTQDRYERQLGLSLDGLSRLLGPRVIQSMALTGSDSYYRTGTDLAVVFQTEQPDVLTALLLAKVAAATAQEKDVRTISGKVEGVNYQGRFSPDRRVSSYIAKVGGAVVLTNSTHQIARLAEAQSGKAASIATLPEFTFFRNRYPLGDPKETALVFLSDATIRRWCGPQWRIATSRRTRSAAVLAEVQAAQMDALAKGEVEPGPIHTEWPLPDDAKLTLTPGGVVSSVHGRIDFLTPIAEVPMTEVGKDEAEAYGRWRDGYQRNWTIGFDPIAIRLELTGESLAADLSVMPLIAGSQYRQFISLSQKAQIAPGAGDPHEAPLHLVVAIDKESPLFQQGANFARAMVKGFSLAWMGDSVAVYADADPFWDELAKTPQEDWSKFFEKEIHRVPVAVNIEVKNGLSLAGFLTGVRGFVEQTAPDMTVWETCQYRGESYVKVMPSEKAKGQNRQSENWTLCYSASGEALVITPSEALLKRAIDRQLAQRKAIAEGKPLEPAPKPWLGENLALAADRQAFSIAGGLFRDDYRHVMQARSWGNLPILNQWHDRYPDQDPVALHERVWGVRLECPGGGKYVWNDKWRTMESTVYGHPGQPKPGPDAPPALAAFSHGDFGVSFADGGLRARAKLERPKAK